MKKYLYFALTLTLALVSCGKKEEETVGLESISLTKRTLTMEVGDTKKLAVEYHPESAAEYAPEVTWESSNASVASVDKTGRVSALRKGQATISAYCGKLFADCAVTVEVGGGNNGGGENGGGENTSKFEVSPTTIDDKGQGGTYTITVTSNRAWTAECEQA